MLDELELARFEGLVGDSFELRRWRSSGVAVGEESIKATVYARNRCERQKGPLPAGRGEAQGR